MVAEATLPRRSIPHLALQLGGLALLLVVAELLPRVTTFHDLATGVANAERIVAAERALGIYTEPEVAAFGAEHDAVATVGNVLYVALHVPVMAGALLWAAYPVFIGALVVVTAHHFWLDAAGGFAVVLLALLVANRVSPPARRR